MKSRCEIGNHMLCPALLNPIHSKKVTPGSVEKLSDGLGLS